MPLPDDLLKQAFELALKEPRKPKQASLRRAISAAYYALFHLLTEAGARRLSPRPNTVPSVRRAFGHAEMREVCASLTGLESRYKIKFPAEITQVGQSFVELQDARNKAEYDYQRLVTRAATLVRCEKARIALDQWRVVKNKPEARIFLWELLIGRKLRRG